MGHRPTYPPTSLLGCVYSSIRSAGVPGIPVTCRWCVTCSGFSGEPDALLGWQTAWPGSWPGERTAPVPLASPGLRKARVASLRRSSSLGHENTRQITGEETRTSALTLVTPRCVSPRPRLCWRPPVPPPTSAVSWAPEHRLCDTQGHCADADRPPLSSRCPHLGSALTFSKSSPPPSPSGGMVSPCTPLSHSQGMSIIAL